MQTDTIDNVVLPAAISSYSSNYTELGKSNEFISILARENRWKTEGRTSRSYSAWGTETVNTNEVLWQEGTRPWHLSRLSISRNCITSWTGRSIALRAWSVRFTSAIIRVSAIISSSLWPESPFPFRATRFFVSSFPAEVELKSHKERVPFLAAVSFEAHLSPLISILMVYSSRSVDDLGLCAQTFPALLG